MSVDVYNEIRAALDTKLAAWPDVPKVGAKLLVNWENAQFEKPTPGTDPWIQVTMIHGPGDGRTLGGTPYTRLQGIYNLNIFAPSGRGTKAADQLADSLMRYFKSGTRLLFPTAVSPTTTVTLRTPFRAPGRTETDWYQIPVQVRWISHTTEL